MDLSQTTPEAIGARLKLARELAGYSSTRQAALALPPGVAVSHATLANYEKGKTIPGMDVLARLAVLYNREVGWFFDSVEPLTGVRFRKTVSRVKAAEERHYLASAQRWLEAYRNLEIRLKQPLPQPPANYIPDLNETGQDFASRVRRRLIGIPDLVPLASVVGPLEKWFGIRVIELPTSARIDGFAAKWGEEHVVILNPRVSNDRARLNAAHELGHVLFRDCESDIETHEAETRGYEFGFNLLMPPAALNKAFEGKSMVRLLQYKEQFGVSLAAMIYRAKQLKIIPASQAERLWIEFAKRGWRTKEPGIVRADRATRFERLYEKAIQSGTVSEYEALRIMGVRAEEMQARLDAATVGWPDEVVGDPSKEEGEEDRPDLIQFPR